MMDIAVLERNEQGAEMEQDTPLAGQPGAVDALRAEVGDSRKVTPERLAKCFSFPLDDFQVQHSSSVEEISTILNQNAWQMGALTALVEKRSVVVSAPTGSGKTVCGEVLRFCMLC